MSNFSVRGKAPGVYVFEKPSGVHTITAVASSITAFLGQALEGPINKPVRILSADKFEKTFGKPHPDSELSIAVSLFFQNGGADCYVVRIVKEGTGAKSSIVLKNEDNSTEVLVFSAKDIGTWGNEIAIEIDYKTSKPEETFHIRVKRLNSDGTVKGNEEEFLNCTMDYNSPRFPPKIITQNSALVDCDLAIPITTYKAHVSNKPGYSESRKLFRKTATGINDLKTILKQQTPPQTQTSKISLSLDGSPYYEIDLADPYTPNVVINSWQVMADELTKKFGAISQLKDKIKVEFQDGPKDGPNDTKVMRLKLDSPELNSITVQPASDKDATKILMLGISEGGVERPRHSYYRPAPSGIFLKLIDTNPNVLAKLNSLAELTQDSFDKIVLDDKEIDLGSKLKTTNPTGTDMWHHGNGGTNKNDNGVMEKLSIIATEINDNATDWIASVTGSRLLITKKTGSPSHIPDFSTKKGLAVVDTKLFESNARFYSLGKPLPKFTGTSAQIGIEGGPPDTASSYIGDEVHHTGMHALDNVDLFNLLVIPDDQTLPEDERLLLWAPASTYCKQKRAFALIGPPRSWSTLSPSAIVEDTAKGIRKLRRGVVLDHSAVYYPRIKIPEKGNFRAVDPCGAIAGIMARTDSDAAGGVWKAPAGLQADFEGSAYDVETNLTDPENGILNSEGVNCLRLFATGLVVWGARTMDGADDFGSEKKYIPISRLTLLIAESLFRGTKWAVFEPNDEPLYAQIRLNVGAFMMSLYRTHAFQGSTPDEAFFVKCDRETTTEQDRNLGIVNIQVGFAPLKPAEFIVITIQQKAGEL